MTAADAARLASRTRLTALAASQLLDSPPEERFDRLTRLAAAAIGAPVSLFTLVTPERQFFKSSHGLREPWATRRETALSHSFCQHVVTTAAPFVVPDARSHPLVSDNLAIDALGVEAYLGVPVVAPGGEVLGSLCVIDHQPREWASDATELLLMLVAILNAELANTPPDGVKSEEVGSFEDLSSREDLNRELRSRQAFLNGLIDAAPIGIQVYGTDGVSRRMNEAFRALLQLPSTDYGVGEYNALTDPVSVASGTAEEFRLAFAGEAVLGREHHVNLSHQRNRWDTRREDLILEQSLVPIRDAEGEVTAVIAFVSDITERKRAEEQMRQAAELTASILDAMGDPMVVTDMNGDVIATNTATERLLGPPHNPSATTLRERFEFKLLLPDGTEIPVHQTPANRARAGEAVDDFEVVFRQEGRKQDRRLIITARPLNNGRGEIDGAVMVFHDVTERRAAEEAARLAGEQIRQVAQTAPVILGALAADGTVLFIEGRALRDSGLDPAEFAGQHYSRWVPTGSPLDNALKRVLAGEEFMDVYPSPVSNRVQQGHHVPLRNAAGELIGATVVLFDITERLEAEAARRQAEKLESLSVLAGGLAHDFNNLLVNILGNAALALMDLPAESGARESILEIESAGRRAAELSRQMLAYSGHGQFFAVEVDLNSIVREVAQRVEVGPRVRLRLDPSLPRVQADPAQLRLAIAGVLNNAVEAIAVGGEVVATSRAIHADAALFARCYLQPALPEGAYASLEVRDTGAGMDADTVARIFDPFFSTKFIGRGLGLAAVLGIVRGHRGAVEVESTPGEGTTFRLYFPLAGAAPAP